MLTRLSRNIQNYWKTYINRLKCVFFPLNLSLFDEWEKSWFKMMSERNLHIENGLSNKNSQKRKKQKQNVKQIVLHKQNFKYFYYCRSVKSCPYRFVNLFWKLIKQYFLIQRCFKWACSISTSARKYLLACTAKWL